MLKVQLLQYNFISCVVSWLDEMVITGLQTYKSHKTAFPFRLTVSELQPQMTSNVLFYLFIYRNTPPYVFLGTKSHMCVNCRTQALWLGCLPQFNRRQNKWAAVITVFLNHLSLFFMLSIHFKAFTVKQVFLKTCNC